MRKGQRVQWNEQLKPKPKELTEYHKDFTILKLLLFNVDP